MERSFGGNCCGCFSMRTGVIILGVLSLIGGISSITYGSILFHDSDSYWSVYYDNTGLLVFCIINGVITVTASICLLVGVNMTSPLLLTPYLVLMLINLVAFVSIAVWALIIGQIAYGLSFIFEVCLAVYFITVVRNYRFQMISFLDSRSCSAPTPGAPVQSVPYMNATAFAAPGIYPGAGAYLPQSGYPPQTAPYSSQSVYQPPPSAYPPQGTYPTQVSYPPQGTYPTQVSYPQQGTYPTQVSYPPQGTYPPQGAYTPHPQNPYPTHTAYSAQSVENRKEVEPQAPPYTPF